MNGGTSFVTLPVGAFEQPNTKGSHLLYFRWVSKNVITIITLYSVPEAKTVCVVFILYFCMAPNLGPSQFFKRIEASNNF